MSSGARRSPSRRDFLKVLGQGLVASTAGPAAFALAAPQSPASVIFTDVTSDAGLSGARNISGSVANKQLLLEEMGGGVALFDYDNDGWLDIFLVTAISSTTIATERSLTSLRRPA